MKDILFKGSRLLIYMAALSHLALSQIHIGVITKVFNPNSGFFLFLFTIFGVVTAFSSSSVKKGSRIEVFILAAILAVSVGFYHLRILFQDINQGNVLTFADIRLSVGLIITTIVAYIVGSVVLIVSGSMKDD